MNEFDTQPPRRDLEIGQLRETKQADLVAAREAVQVSDNESEINSLESTALDPDEADLVAPPPANKVFVIYYNQTITGSQELRSYNNTMVTDCYPELEKLDKHSPLHYYSKYDLSPGGKAAEPFYDAFLVHMATLDASKHEEYGLEEIVYYEEEYKSVKENKGEESQFTKTFLKNYGDNEPLPRKRDEMNYNTAKHIFLLCPTANYMVKDILDLIKNPDSTIIIHIQGDIKNMAEDRITNSVNKTINQRCAMKTPEGMFNDAFNLYSGGEDHRLLREELHKRGARFFSASPKFYDVRNHEKFSGVLNDAKQSAIVAAQEQVKAEKAAKAAAEAAEKAEKSATRNIRKMAAKVTGRSGYFSGKGSKAKVAAAAKAAAAGAAKKATDLAKFASTGVNTPLYYIKANNDILMLSATKAEQASVYEKLTNNKNTLVEGPIMKVSNLKITNILKVYQDGTDKDNLAGLILLGAASTGTNIPIDLDFIGLRIYTSTSLPFPKSTFLLPFRTKDGKARGGIMRETEEFFQPGDKDPNEGNIEYQPEFTEKFYTAQLEGFKKSLNMSRPDIFTFNNSEGDISNYIVDGSGNTSKSLRAPFNMSLFFWAPETYMAKAIITATDSYTGVKGKFTFKKEDYETAMSKIKGVPADTSVRSQVALKIEDVPVITDGGKRKRRTRKNKKYNKKSKKHHKKRSYKKQHKKIHHKRRTHKRR